MRGTAEPVPATPLSGAPGDGAAIVGAPIAYEALAARVAGDDAGALASFVGVVRNRNAGRAVEGIAYDAYVPMAQRELAAIVAEVEAQHAGARVAAAHRIGYVAVGEASVAVVAAHAHRGPAFDACRAVIEAIKRRLPIWKFEHYVDGERAWVDARIGGGGHA